MATNNRKAAEKVVEEIEKEKADEAVAVVNPAPEKKSPPKKTDAPKNKVNKTEYRKGTFRIDR